MTGLVISFPKRSRHREFVEVERCSDPATGCPLFVFEVVTRDDRRVGIGVRDSLDEALDDIAWLRRGGVPVVEVGPLGSAA